MKNVLKIKPKDNPEKEIVEPKYVEDKATKQYLDYINDHGNVMRHNGKDYYNTGINLKGPRGAVGPRGLPGKDGLTPHIGENGNWFIGTQDTGTLAELDVDDYATKQDLQRLETLIGNTPELQQAQVLAQAIIQLNADIQGLRTMFTTGLENIKVNNLDSNNLPTVLETPMFSTGSGAPSVVPEFVGQRYYDTTNNKEYVAVAVTSSTNDWKVV